MPNFTVFNTNPDHLRTLIFGQDATGIARPVATDENGNVLTVLMNGTIGNLTISAATITGGTLTNLLNGTITSVMGATITAGTLSTVTSVLGATITAGTLTNLLNGTITSVMGATITAGTLSTVSNVLGATITAGTLTNLLNGTITSVLGATITAGTLSTVSNVLGATITAGTLSSVTSISQKSFYENQNTDVVTGNAFSAITAVTTSTLGTYSFFVYNKGPGTAKVDARVEISANGTNWFDDVDTVTGIAVGSVDVLVPQRFLKYTRLSYRSSSSGNATTIDVIFNAQGT